MLTLIATTIGIGDRLVRFLSNDFTFIGTFASVHFHAYERWRYGGASMIPFRLEISRLLRLPF